MIASSNNMQLITTIFGNAKIIRVMTIDNINIDVIKINVFIVEYLFSVF